MELNTSQQSNIELYFDHGSGFHANEVAVFPYTPNDHFNHYRSSIPYADIKAVRIDPAKAAGLFSIRSITTYSGKTQVSTQGAELLAHIIETNGVIDLVVHDGILSGKALTDDPYLVVETEQFGRTHLPFGQRLLFSLGAILLTATIFLTICYFPKISFLSFFAFILLFVFQQEGFFPKPLNVVTILTNSALILNIISGLSIGILSSYWLSKHHKKSTVTEDNVTVFYRALVFALSIVIAGIWLDPISPWLSLTFAALVLAYCGGTVTNGLRQLIKSLVHENDSIPPRTAWLLKFLLFVSILWLIVDRAPSMIYDPRIWAEDGRHTLVAMFKHHGFDALFWYDEYFRILSNFAGLLSTRIFPLENAAYVFTFTALSIKLIPFLLVIVGKSSLWNTTAKKIVFCLLILYAPMSQEIWLNVNGSHYYMTLIAILLLAEIELATSKIRLWCYYLLLGVSSLSGILPCIMTPLYWMRAYQLRNRQTFFAALILTSGMLIQIFLILLFDGSTPPRGTAATTDIAGWIVVIKTILLPLNEGWARLGFSLSREITAGLGPFSSGQVLLTGYLTLILLLLFILRKSVAAYFLLAYLGLLLMTLLFGLGGPEQSVFRHPFVGNRYFYVPNALFLIVLVAALQQLGSRIAVSLCAVTIVIFSTFVISNNSSLFMSQPVILEGLPSWSSEIRRWRQDPEQPVQIWPYGWDIKINSSQDR